MSLTFPESETLTVPESAAGERLDAFLSAVLPHTRSRIQRGIEAGDVLLNGKTVKSSYRIRTGDRIDPDLPEMVTTEIVPEDIPINIVHEDDDLLVVEKRAGMVVHPAAGISFGTLANALVFRFRRESTNDDGTPFRETIRPGLVHRLDKDTSGLLVVAKTETALEHLSGQFRDRTVEKHYTALVYGMVGAPGGVIDAPIGRDRNNRLKMAVQRRGEGRDALSIYRVLRRFDEFTLLDVEIKTGRTHQIRVHCEYLKHPVVADELYAKGRTKQIRNTLHRQAAECLGRQFLHASRLSFTHPTTGTRLDFTSELPEELARFLALIENRA